MAIFTNQATLTYNGITTNSNIAFGELLELLTATKTAVEGAYRSGDLVTYVVTLRNTGATTLTGLTVTDDLGGYAVGGTTVYPLAYADGTARVFQNGVPQPAPTVTAGPPMTITGITVPADGDTVIVYQARVTDFANPGTDGTIVNTVNVTGAGLTTPVTATETVNAATGPELTITKSITPAQVSDNDRVTYTFLIQNYGNEEVVVTDNASITDTFDPILTALAVSFEGTPWTENAQYTYNQATGLFTTAPGAITVPAATVTQDPATGAYTVTPGTATLTVTGTI